MSAGGHGNFLWENHSWAFSNSDNSGASEEKSGKKPALDSSSNSPTEIISQGQKRGRKGVPKNGMGSGEWNECKDGGAGGGGESDHEIHIWTERERRKKMRNMFSNLHALLPELPAKADKSTIVDEAVNYIRTLQQTLQRLQKQKLEMLRGATTTTDYDPPVVARQTLALNSRESFLADQGSSMNLPMPTNHSPVPACFQTWSSPNVVLNVCGDDAQISVCSPRKPGLLTTIFYVLEKHKLEVVTAQISSDYYRSMFMIHAHASGSLDQFSEEALPVEEIYKLAVGEMMCCLSS